MCSARAATKPKKLQPEVVFECLGSMQSRTCFAFRCKAALRWEKIVTYTISIVIHHVAMIHHIEATPRNRRSPRHLCQGLRATVADFVALVFLRLTRAVYGIRAVLYKEDPCSVPNMVRHPCKRGPNSENYPYEQLKTKTRA